MCIMQQATGGSLMEPEALIHKGFPQHVEKWSWEGQLSPGAIKPAARSALRAALPGDQGCALDGSRSRPKPTNFACPFLLRPSVLSDTVVHVHVTQAT